MQTMYHGEFNTFSTGSEKIFGVQTITPSQLKRTTVRIFSAEPHGSGMYEIPRCAVLQLLPLMFTPELARTRSMAPWSWTHTTIACSSSPNGGVTQLHNSGGTATLMLH